MTSKRQIRVFIASPGDLDTERKVFRKQIEQLNQGFGDGANVEFIPLGWEDTLASTGPRTQSVFNRLIDSCEIFILALSRRWGRDAQDSEYSSYTEEEFHTALERYKKDRCPEIFIFFKGVDTESLANPDPQLQKILDFKLSLEEAGNTRHCEFDDSKGFASLLSSHLRAFAKGEIQPLEPGEFQTPLPLEARQKLQEAQEEIAIINQQLKTEIAKADNSSQQTLRAEELSLALAKTASEMALEGKIEKAKILFAQSVQGSNRVKVIHLAAEFYLRIGNLSSAEALFARGLAGVDESTASLFLAGLAAIATTRGDIDKAETIYRKILALGKKLDDTIGEASAYGCLGNIFKARGEQVQAEDMYKKALVILEKHDHQEMMAVQYNNLGLVFYQRSDFSQAESLFRKALVINEQLNQQERAASAHFNLGNIYRARGDLGHAESRYRQALTLDEKIGCLKGVARDYNNLGIIFKSRGELSQAESMYGKSLATYEKLNRPPGIADVYGNLGDLFKYYGNLDQAEAMHFKALEIDEGVGNPEGIAMSYFNLGILSQIRGDWNKAEQLYRKALPHFEMLGSKDYIDQTNKLLHDLRDSSLKKHIKNSFLKSAMGLVSYLDNQREIKRKKGLSPSTKDVSQVKD